MTNHTHISLRICKLVAAAVVALVSCAFPANALDLSTYAPRSVLAEGKWAKISVDRTGAFILTPQALKQMGFSNPANVRIYGYGASRLPDRLDQSYVDDLPLVQSVATDAGIVFYGVGPTSISGNRPVQNPYTTVGYYFITESDTPLPQMPSTALTRKGDNPATTFTDYAVHERELESPGKTGHILVGESFLSQAKRTFELPLPGNAGKEATLYASFVAKSAGESKVTFTVDGKEIAYGSADRMGALRDQHSHYTEALPTKKIEIDGSKTSVTVAFTSSKNASLANLNYLCVAYQRNLRLADNQLTFSHASIEMQLTGATAKTILWDVTNPLAPKEVKTLHDGGETLCWQQTEGGMRSYVAFTPSATLPQPKYAGNVENQNLHSIESADMVIFAPREYLDQAKRLAQRRHSGPDALEVEVIDQALVFNEFASGAADAQAFRKMLKMVYDRTSAAGRPLRFALFFGRGTYDNRQLTPSVASTRYPKMPIWQTDRGANDSDSYSTDDMFAFLADGSGQNMSSDIFSIAVGRLPVTSAADAKAAVDKIVEYEEKMPLTNWRNRILLVADDEDGAIHLTQTEEMWRLMEQSAGGTDINYNKLYTDLYPREGNVARLAHDNLIKNLEEGMAWLTYIGHANTTSWSHESLLTYTDINNLHLRHYPILYGATCEFLRWDGESVSAAEIMWKLPTGGAIAVISANRPVYISENGPLSAAFGRHMFRRGADNRRLTLGEIYQAAKNDYRNTDKNGNYLPVTANSNKLRYVLMGDPSMRPIVPDNNVEIESIAGTDPASETEQAVIKANQDVRIAGRITDHDGNPADTFEGTLNITLYDADRSYTTLGLGESGIPKTFDQHGDRLYEGYHRVQNGRFDFTIPMPSEIAGNFRPATMAFYAFTADGSADATGIENRFYVFGRDESGVSDTIPPVIETICLNHPSFADGDRVNPSPVLIADISDNRALNMSTAGIGHQMVIKLDGNKTYTDVVQYFSADTSGQPRGTIAYPLDGLAEGPHSLMLRIWDAAGNSATSDIAFTVDERSAPVLYDVFTDSNPASVEANFYLSHNRPEAMIDVTISVYNLLGKPVWSTTQTGRSDIFLSFPVKWDLTDNAGRRVQRGIYLYRASIKSEGVESETLTHKIAVAAQ